MPDLPSTARFLTSEEKIVAVERVATNRQGVKNHHFKTYQVWQAVRDPKTWILFIMAVSTRSAALTHAIGASHILTDGTRLPHKFRMLLNQR